MNHADLIIAAHQVHARRVAVGMVVTRPVRPIFRIFPRIFIVDFFRGLIETRRYTNYYMGPIYLTLSVIQEMQQFEIDSERMNLLAEEIREWLMAHKLNFDPVHEKHMSRCRLLVEHFNRLLAANGGTYQELVRAVYPAVEEYRLFLERLNNLEAEIDEAITEAYLADVKVVRRLRSEREHTIRQRDRELKSIYQT